MNKKTRSILEELNSISIDRERPLVLENRVEHIVSSVQNILEQIHQNYDPEQAQDLERRLFNSVRSGDASKFSRGLSRAARERK